jgi:hypothetical protein
VKECLWLPELTAKLPVPVPAPVAAGQPNDRFPWSRSIVPWFDGVVADIVSAAERAAFAEQLDDVVLALHSAAPADAPFEVMRGFPLIESGELVRGWIGSAPITGSEGAGLSAIWAAGLAAPDWRGRACGCTTISVQGTTSSTPPPVDLPRSSTSEIWDRATPPLTSPQRG